MSQTAWAEKGVYPPVGLRWAGFDKGWGVRRFPDLFLQNSKTLDFIDLPADYHEKFLHYVGQCGSGWSGVEASCRLHLLMASERLRTKWLWIASSCILNMA